MSIGLSQLPFSLLSGVAELSQNKVSATPILPYSARALAD